MESAQDVSNNTHEVNYDSLDYDTPHDTAMPAILAGILIPHATCTLVVVARVAARRLHGTWSPSDTLALLSWACSTAICIIYSIAAYTPDILLAPSELALQNDAPEGSVHPYIMRTYLGLIFYQLCLCLTKLSVLSFYLGALHRRAERRLTWATIVAVILYGVPLLFTSIFQCHPQEGHFFGRRMTCVSFSPLLISSAALHGATTAWLILLAVPAVSRLDRPPRQKVALAVILSLGIFVIAAGLLRLQMGLSGDFRRGSVGATNTLAFFVVTVLECDVALICASAPTLGPLVARVWRGFMGEEARGRRSREPLRRDSESLDLTGRVSYHGYPWTRPGTAASGRKGSGLAGRVYGHLRTPTGEVRGGSASRAGVSTPQRSMRTLLSGTRTPTRPRVYTEEEMRSVSRGNATGESRPVSLGFEEYFLALANHPPPTASRKNKGASWPSDDAVTGRWDRSQESFVLGVNDPRNSRMAPPPPDGGVGGRDVESSVASSEAGSPTTETPEKAGM
ncbi:uncharacterized protein DNG_10245 [Cephalotrichum gorgonifer]|uniref:Rhodopsin domain-containing protein n=1 Tax=Cephalotrichum gorgonifer TaxID=2041049 RepID=A0AAE8N786_9PEZI|nr:uncharacterized protein DNG_10245 [Cephalotrichum gorgonifer]